MPLPIFCNETINGHTDMADRDDDGILTVTIYDFLLDPKIFEK